MGGKFGPSSDQLFHLVSELQEVGVGVTGEEGDLDGVWGGE